MMGTPTEQFLALLGCGTTPTEFNPTPGLGPILRMEGPDKFAWFEPQTEAEQALKDAATVMLRGRFHPDYTPEEHRSYRLALYAVYCEQGFTGEELEEFFPDMLSQDTSPVD